MVTPKDSAIFREGIHKKGGMNVDPPANYVPPKPTSFKAMIDKMAGSELSAELKLAQALVVIQSLKLALDQERSAHRETIDRWAWSINIRPKPEPGFIARLLGLS